jgi:hypothetical protein
MRRSWGWSHKDDLSFKGLWVVVGEEINVESKIPEDRSKQWSRLVMRVAYKRTATATGKQKAFNQCQPQFIYLLLLLLRSLNLKQLHAFVLSEELFLHTHLRFYFLGQ